MTRTSLTSENAIDAGARSSFRPRPRGSAGGPLEAGLYLWATRTADVNGVQAPCWETTRWLAERAFSSPRVLLYGDAGRRNIRMALTASDERITGAAERLG